MTVKDVNCALNFKSNEKPAFYLVIREARRHSARAPSFCTKEAFLRINPHVILSGTEYGKERFKKNKTLCHSERSAAQPKNPGIAA